MANSSSSNIPVSLALEWYKIRDMFFGLNKVAQDFHLVLLLASSCKHPDACWLSSVCAGKIVKTGRQLRRQVFLALGQEDARAVCFAWMLGGRSDWTPLRRVAELGYAFAQSSLASRTESVEPFMFAQLAVSQGERDGFYELGCCVAMGARRIWKRQSKTFCWQPTKNMSWQCVCLDICLTSLIRRNGDGWVLRQLVARKDTSLHAFQKPSRSSLLVQEMLPVCLQLAKFCKDK